MKNPAGFTAGARKQRYTNMEGKNANPSIECTVTQCANHAKTKGYCALDKIKVGTHEANPTVMQCVDCESFVLGHDCKDCK